jgi:hypothetical protein
MSTVTENIARAIIANEGLYPGDFTRAVKVIRYNNMFDGAFAYGVVYPGEDYNRYENSPACRNTIVLWTFKDGLLRSF